jgi:hypothetical protein
MATEIDKHFKPSVRYFNVSNPPKADVVITEKESTNRNFQVLTIPSILPSSEKDEFLLQIRASVISEIRESAIKVNSKKYNYSEIWLGLCTVCLGAVFNNYDSQYIYLILAFLIGVSGVTYYFTRKVNIDRFSEFATKVLKLLPNEKENKPDGY